MFECIVCGTMAEQWGSTSICVSCYIKKLKEKNKELQKELDYTRYLACERCQGTDHKCKDCSIHHKRIKEENKKCITMK